MVHLDEIDRKQGKDWDRRSVNVSCCGTIDPRQTNRHNTAQLRHQPIIHFNLDSIHRKQGRKQGKESDRWHLIMQDTHLLWSTDLEGIQLLYIATVSEAQSTDWGCLERREVARREEREMRTEQWPFSRIPRTWPSWPTTSRTCFSRCRTGGLIRSSRSGMYLHSSSPQVPDNVGPDNLQNWRHGNADRWSRT